MESSNLTGHQLGQYDLIAELGRGTYTRIYQAFQPRLRRHVAIKVLPIDAQDRAGFIQRFEQTSQAIAQLNHPAIVSIYDFGEEQGLAYLVMQSVTGGSFKARLGKPMAVGEAVTPVIQLARALHHAHQRGVLHLDVRPANILIDQENPTHLLLTDFSLSQLLQPIYLARTGLPPGAPAYLAPEQVEGGPVDARTDVYSLGALLFEALAGQPPFSGASPAIILNKHVHEPPPYIRGFNPAVPRDLAHVVARAMAKRREERFASAEEFARVLEPYRDTTERHHHLHLTLEDLNLPDDEADSGAEGAARPADPAKPARPQRRFGRGGLNQAQYMGGALPSSERAAWKEISAILTTRPISEETVALVPRIGAGLFHLLRRVAGHSPLGDRVDYTARNPIVQMTAGIASIALVLTLALSLTLLAVVRPPADGIRAVGPGLGLSNPTPTATATLAPSPTATASPTPSPTATPSGPAIDPAAAAVLARMTAATGIDAACRSNNAGATLPARQGVFVTLCFNPGAIAGGGTASVWIVPQGATSTTIQASSAVRGGSGYQWFQFSPLPPGNYLVEGFWNGALGRVYPLSIGA